MRKTHENPTLTLWARLIAILVTVMMVIVQGYTQNLEVAGKVKITEMDSIAIGDKVVVRDATGNLAERDLSSVVISYFLNLPNGPQTLLEAGESVSNLVLAGASVNALLDAGVSVGDLIAAGVSVDDLVDGGVKVADLLSNGIPPLEIFNAGVEIDSFYGKTYEGGLIFYLNTSTGNGLVSAPDDQNMGMGIEWDESLFTTNAIGAAIGTGQANTTTIVGIVGPGAYAASICDNLNINSKNDWFLPSRDELNEMYTKLKLNGSGGFSTGYYWSSTEASSSTAWGQDFATGSQDQLPKDDTNGHL